MRRFQITFENSKLRSRSGKRSKSGVFRLRTVETSNVAFFAQNFPNVLPRTGRRYWLVIFFIFSSGQGQVKGHQTQHFQMSRLTHVSWSILDDELYSHGYFTIWLHLNQKMSKKSGQNVGSGQKFQKGSNFHFFKQICFLRRISSAIQWYH